MRRDDDGDAGKKRWGPNPKTQSTEGLSGRLQLWLWEISGDIVGEEEE